MICLIISWQQFILNICDIANVQKKILWFTATFFTIAKFHDLSRPEIISFPLMSLISLELRHTQAQLEYILGY